MLRLPDTGEQYDATDPDAEKKARAASELRESRLRNVEAALLSTPQGREWVWGVLTGDCHVWEKRIALSGGHEQAFLDGAQHVGHGLMRRLAKAAPTNFALMLTENDR